MGTFVVCTKKKPDEKKILQKLELIKWMDENLNEMMTAILIDNSRRKKTFTTANWNKYTLKRIQAINKSHKVSGLFMVMDLDFSVLQQVVLRVIHNAILIKLLNQVLFAVWFFFFFYFICLFLSNEMNKNSFKLR